MSELARAECVKIHATTVHRQRANRTIGAVQPSCIITCSQQIPWRNRRGGIVDPGGGFLGLGFGVQRGYVSRVKCQN